MKILIKGTNWIGDAVMTIPAMRRLRSAFPDAWIALHTREWARGVFSEAEFLNEIISINPAGSRTRTVFREARTLRARGFDTVVLFPNSFESALTAYLAGVPRRFGYRTDARRILLTDSIAVPSWKNQRHESDYYLLLADHVTEALGGSEPGGESADQLLYISSEKRSQALDLLGSSGVEKDRPLIALGPGSTNSIAKRWPIDHFAQLCSMLADGYEARFLLLGSKQEAEVGAALSSLLSVSVTDLIGKTELDEVTGILGAVDLFISNDMGLAHIAAALGTPTLTLFGPTNEVTTAPLGPQARYVREVVECSPCMLRDCPIDHRCMRRLTPERVFEAASRMLQNLNSN